MRGSVVAGLLVSVLGVACSEDATQIALRNEIGWYQGNGATNIQMDLLRVELNHVPLGDLPYGATTEYVEFERFPTDSVPLWWATMRRRSMTESRTTVEHLVEFDLTSEVWVPPVISVEPGTRTLVRLCRDGEVYSNESR